MCQPICAVWVLAFSWHNLGSGEIRDVEETRLFCGVFVTCCLFPCCCCCWVDSVVSNSVRPYSQQPTRLCCPWDSPGKNTGAGCHFPSPMHESEKWKCNRSVMSDSSRPHGLQPTRLLHPWDFPGKSTGVGCHRLLRSFSLGLIPNWVQAFPFLSIFFYFPFLPSSPPIPLSLLSFLSFFPLCTWIFCAFLYLEILQLQVSWNSSAVLGSFLFWKDIFSMLFCLIWVRDKVYIWPVNPTWQ